MTKQEIISELVQEWFKKAENDLYSAENLIMLDYKPTDVICFHCQQTGEKYLKGFLVFYQIEFEKTHNLSELIELCSKKDNAFLTLESEAKLLTSYAIEPRYPLRIEYSLEITEEAIEMAKKIKEFVLDKLKTKL